MEVELSVPTPEPEQVGNNNESKELEIKKPKKLIRKRVTRRATPVIKMESDKISSRKSHDFFDKRSSS